MATTFIIEEQNRIIFNDKAGCPLIPYPSDENLLEDHQLHDWITMVFKNYDPSSLTIPLSIQNDRFKGLMLGLHIRLHHELSLKQRTIPLFFISDEFDYGDIFSDTTLEIKNNRALPHYLLTTPNCFLETPDLGIIKKAITICKPMSLYDYRHKFLDVIKVNASETTGKHSIANIWGAFQLARVTGHTKAISKNPKLLRDQKDLYFKYIRAQLPLLDDGNIKADSKSDGKQPGPKVLKIRSLGKNILYIDDEANKGWDIVLSGLFDEANFEFVGREHKEEFNSFYDKALKKALEVDKEGISKWDLILLDLRLDEVEDIGDNASKKAEDFSGAKLLLKIKKVNKGTQVFMFTASNKAWNMRDLMNPSIGANGFYIKESPEYSQDPSFSKRNFESFQKQVDECLKRGNLRKIFKIINNIKNHSPNFKRINPSVSSLNSLYDQLEGQRHWLEICATLDNIFFNLDSSLDERFNFSMLLLYRNFELLNEWFYNGNEPLAFKTGEVKKLILENSVSKSYSEGALSQANQLIHKSTGNKVQSILYQKLRIYDYSTLKGIQKLSSYRNDFLHPEKRYKLNKIQNKDILDWLILQEKILTAI